MDDRSRVHRARVPATLGLIIIIDDARRFRESRVPKRPDMKLRPEFAELRELAGERWADVADQAPTVYAVWGGGATPAQAPKAAA
jgi:hypothetical protein